MFCLRSNAPVLHIEFILFEVPNPRTLNPCKLGWLRGFEPPPPGTTIRCSNQLSYNHHFQEGEYQRKSAGM